MRYSEKIITDSNMDDIITAAVRYIYIYTCMVHDMIHVLVVCAYYSAPCFTRTFACRDQSVVSIQWNHSYCWGGLKCPE